MTTDANDIARQLGVTGLRKVWDASAPASGGGKSGTKRAAGPSVPESSEEALALRFATRHEADLRYVDAWSKWMFWDGRRWQLDKTLCAFDLVREICREASSECGSQKAASVLASAKTVAAVERLAKADRRLAATTDQWDADPWLLNTPGGVVDLKTGTVRQHQPDDFLTKIAAVGPHGECPQWLAFLTRVTGGDKELQSFIQRVAGYLLTGDTSAQALFFLFGTGANGKSVCIETLAGILHDYHRVAAIETFTATSVERHPTDLAGLHGARLVTAVETEEGRRWAESRIKALTGGDKVTAHFMRQDYFDFTPQFKLVIAGNHKPGLRSVDEAIRRRFHLVPFTVTIPPQERDAELKQKLKTEWPGILQWMIEGCLDWQQNGLCPPEAVRVATEAYLEGEDATAAWMDECCERDSTAWESSADLFASWKAWADRSGEFAGAMRRFVQNLETRGFRPHRKSHGRGFHGLKIRPDGVTPHWND